MPRSTYLIGHWFIFQPRLVQELFNLEVVEVGDTKGFHQPFIDQLLHDLSQKGNLGSRGGVGWNNRDTGLA